MKIKVTRQNIDCGGTSTSTCPVARAIRREIGDIYAYISVWSSKIFINGREYETPDAAREFILKFDDDVPRHELEPFEFEMDI